MRQRLAEKEQQAIMLRIAIIRISVSPILISLCLLGKPDLSPLPETQHTAYPPLIVTRASLLGFEFALPPFTVRIAAALLEAAVWPLTVSTIASIPASVNKRKIKTPNKKNHGNMISPITIR